MNITACILKSFQLSQLLISVYLIALIGLFPLGCVLVFFLATKQSTACYLSGEK